MLLFDLVCTYFFVKLSKSHLFDQGPKAFLPSFEFKTLWAKANEAVVLFSMTSEVLG